MPVRPGFANVKYRQGGTKKCWKKNKERFPLQSFRWPLVGKCWVQYDIFGNRKVRLSDSFCFNIMFDKKRVWVT